jgi:hypothetical protein
MATTKDTTRFFKFTANGRLIPCNPLDDIPEPDPVEYGWFVNGSAYGNGESSEQGKKEYTLNVALGSEAYNTFLAWQQLDDHGLGKDIYFHVEYNRGSMGNEYKGDCAKGYDMHCKIVVVQPIKHTGALYKKDSTSLEESTATIKFGCFLAEEPTPIY